MNCKSGIRYQESHTCVYTLKGHKHPRFTSLLYVFCRLLQPPHVPDEKITGKPFVITDTTAVDLFPHTKHFELLLLFER